MSSTTSETYAQWLQRQMTERGLSQRQLGGLLTPSDPEIGRRSVRRYLKGMIPIERNRQTIAVALGTEDTGPSAADAEDD